VVTTPGRTPAGREVSAPIGYVTQYYEQRLAAATRLFESAAKTLAQVQKLLRPKAPVVAQQQIVNM